VSKWFPWTYRNENGEIVTPCSDQRWQAERHGLHNIARWCLAKFPSLPEWRQRQPEWLEYKRWLRGVIHDVWHPTKLRLRVIHNEIAKHTPSPFPNADLIEWGIKPKPVKRKRLWSTPSLIEIPRQLNQHTIRRL
jgi:hypothetical protein